MRRALVLSLFLAGSLLSPGTPAAFASFFPGEGEFALTISPTVPTHDEPLAITVSGIASCPFVFPPEVTGDTIVIPFSCGCVILPPDPSFFSEDVMLEPLAAGEYTVQLLLIDNSANEVLTETELTVHEALARSVFVEPSEITDNEVARVIVTGVLGCAEAELTSVYVDDHYAQVYGEAPIFDGACLVPQPWAFTAEIGPFKPGVATVDVLVIDHNQGEEPIFWGSQVLEVTDGPEVVALHDERFTVSVRWSDFDGDTGPGLPVPGRSSGETALFAFFDTDNWEVMVKVLDGCVENGHWWVFTAASTNVEYTIEVHDAVNDETWRFTNPLGESSPSVNDVMAFPCP